MRKVLSLCFKYEVPEEYLDWLVALDSETDGYPCDSDRSYWSDSKLSEQDAELVKLYGEDLMALPDVLDRLLLRIEAQGADSIER